MKKHTVAILLLRRKQTTHHKSPTMLISYVDDPLGSPAPYAGLWTTTLTTSQLDKTRLGDDVVKRIVAIAVYTSQQIARSRVEIYGQENTFNLEGRLFLEAVIGNKTPGSTIQFMLSSYDKDTKMFGLTIVEGKASLAKLITGVRATEADCTQFIKQTNDKIVSIAARGNESVPPMFS